MMATPVKDTPTLEGNDAKKFMAQLLDVIVDREKGKNSEKKETELAQMEKSYRVVQAISNGAF
jgi:hypothetical protein